MDHMQMEVPRINKEQLLRQFAVLGDIVNAGTLLIDLRKNDFEGGTIRGSLNLPAESFALMVPTLYRLCAGDGFAVMSRVVFYCSSSNNRAPRCATWFSEYVNARSAQEGTPPLTQVFVMEGGLKGWVNGGENYTTFMDAYVPSYWQKELSGFNKRSSRDEEDEEEQVWDQPQQQYNHAIPVKRMRNEEEAPVMMHQPVQEIPRMVEYTVQEAPIMMEHHHVQEAPAQMESHSQEAPVMMGGVIQEAPVMMEQVPQQQQQHQPSFEQLMERPIENSMEQQAPMFHNIEQSAMEMHHAVEQPQNMMEHHTEQPQMMEQPVEQPHMMSGHNMEQPFAIPQNNMHGTHIMIGGMMIGAMQDAPSLIGHQVEVPMMMM